MIEGFVKETITGRLTVYFAEEFTCYHHDYFRVSVAVLGNLFYEGLLQFFKLLIGESFDLITVQLMILRFVWEHALCDIGKLLVHHKISIQELESLTLKRFSLLQAAG